MHVYCTVGHDFLDKGYGACATPSRGPRTHIIGFRSRYHSEYSIWGLDPHYLSPWTLKVQLCKDAQGVELEMFQVSAVPNTTKWGLPCDKGTPIPFCSYLLQGPSKTKGPCFVVACISCFVGPSPRWAQVSGALLKPRCLYWGYVKVKTPKCRVIVGNRFSSFVNAK